MDILLNIVQFFGIMIIIVNIVILNVFIISTVILLFIDAFECGIISIENNAKYRLFIFFMSAILLNIDFIIQTFKFFKINVNEYIPLFVKWKNDLMSNIHNFSNKIIQDGHVYANALIKIKNDLKCLKKDDHTQELYIEMTIYIYGHSIKSVEESIVCTLPTNLKNIWCMLYIYDKNIYCDFLDKNNNILMYKKPINILYDVGKYANIVSFSMLHGKITCNIKEAYVLLNRDI